MRTYSLSRVILRPVPMVALGCHSQDLTRAACPRQRSGTAPLTSDLPAGDL